MDLGNLTLTACRRQLGEIFTIEPASGPAIALELVRAEPAPRDPTATDLAADRPFSLLFRGAGDLSLGQGCYDLRHETLPLSGIFLVPVGGDPEGMVYEAVFS